MTPSPYFTAFLVAAAYLSGSIPFGLIVARMRGVDVREVGSGNIGATNVSRAVGKKLGAVVLLLDAAKGALPVAAALLLARAGIASPIGVAACALAAVAGHCFPVWLKFRGGKGVATALGVFLVLDPLAALLAVVVFAVVVALSRVAAVGSLVAALAFVITLQLRGRGPEEVALASVIFAIIVVRHVDNIRRLFRGKEHQAP
jgi:glycerol-3-phosphate acyltransferase PlsY